MEHRLSSDFNYVCKIPYQKSSSPDYFHTHLHVIMEPSLRAISRSIFNFLSWDKNCRIQEPFPLKYIDQRFFPYSWGSQYSFEVKIVKIAKIIMWWPILKLRWNLKNHVQHDAVQEENFFLEFWRVEVVGKGSHYLNLQSPVVAICFGWVTVVGMNVIITCKCVWNFRCDEDFW